MCHQQVLSCHSASIASQVERAEDTRNPPWQTKGGGEMLENNPPRTYATTCKAGTHLGKPREEEKCLRTIPQEHTLRPARQETAVGHHSTWNIHFQWQKTTRALIDCYEKDM